jgi:hypothetical protein
MRYGAKIEAVEYLIDTAVHVDVRTQWMALVKPLDVIRPNGIHHVKTNYETPVNVAVPHEEAIL